MRNIDLSKVKTRKDLNDTLRLLEVAWADVSKIKEEIGWEAKTSIKDGLRKTIEWYKEQLC